MAKQVRLALLLSSSCFSQFPPFLYTAWFSGALVYDLDDDGQNELIACYYSVFVYRVQTVKSVSTLKKIWSNPEGSSVGRAYAPCAVADIDGNGSTEIITARGNVVSVYTWDKMTSTATMKSGFPVNTDKYGKAELRGLAVRDLDGDGISEIVANGGLVS